MNTDAARTTGQKEKRKLPAGWRWVRLGEVCEITAGQSPPGSTYRNSPDGLPFFQGKADFGEISPIARVWCVEPTKIAHPGDILISVRAPVGPTNIANFECCIGRGVAAIRCGQNTDRDFMLNTLRHLEALLVKKGSGSTFDAINRKDLESFEIPFPPLAEQQRIAGVLKEQIAVVQRARQAAQAQLEAVKALPAAFLHQIFPQPGQPLPEGWRWVRLGDMMQETRNGLYKPDIYYGTGTRILKMFNIGRLDGSWDLKHVDLIELTKDEEANYSLDEGDILFNRVNSNELVGKCAVIDSRAAGSVFESKNIRLRLKPMQADPWFVATFLNSQGGRNQIQQRLKQIVGQATVNRSDLNRFEIPLPSLPEQRQIAVTLKEQTAAVEKARAAAEAELAAINALPAMLLRLAFNGEL